MNDYPELKNDRLSTEPSIMPELSKELKNFFLVVCEAFGFKYIETAHTKVTNPVTCTYWRNRRVKNPRDVVATEILRKVRELDETV